MQTITLFIEKVEINFERLLVVTFTFVLFSRIIVMSSHLFSCTKFVFLNT